LLDSAAPDAAKNAHHNERWSLLRGARRARWVRRTHLGAVVHDMHLGGLAVRVVDDLDAEREAPVAPIGDGDVRHAPHQHQHAVVQRRAARRRTASRRQRHRAGHSGAHLPGWLEAALAANPIRPVEPEPPRKRRGASTYTNPSPKTNKVLALLQENPTWGVQELATEAGCSKALAEHVRRRVKEERCL
jgi:hypothetical protein